MDFKLLQSGIFYETTPFSKYRDTNTGLTVTIFEHDGPIYSTEIALKTLTDDNCGLPHTLEHLVFMGSSSYPKGFLDLAANQCLSMGTNAWTSQDYTSYTVSCAGKEGFLTFLPVFLDHILFPLLTDEAYVTEVHHVSGEGEDGGVVYCEMQTYENTIECTAERAFSEVLYGKEHPYSVETGGMLYDIRSSCNADKCREYHKTFYNPENMNIVIFGKVGIHEIREVLTPTIYQKIINSKPDITVPISRSLHPFENKVCGFKETPPVTIPFPSPEPEDPGCILLGFTSWPLNNNLKILAENTIVEYLINTSASPLTKRLVHSSPPLCGSVSYRRYNYPTTILKIILNETDSKSHGVIKDEVCRVLLEVLRVGVDTDKIKKILSNKYSDSKLELENRVFEELTTYAVLDNAYGGYYPELLSNYSKIKCCYDQLLEVNQGFWHEILQNLFDSLSVYLIAQPSPEVLQKLETSEEERIEKRVEDLGEEKIDELGEILKKAEEFNNNKLPEGLFDSLKKPDLSSLLAFDKSSIYPTGSSPNLYLHIADSSFYRVYFIIDTDKFSLVEKSHVPLLTASCCNLPVLEAFGGPALTGDEVASKCENIFLNFKVDLELFDEQICMEFSFKSEFLEECLQFLQQLLFSQTVDQSKIDQYIKTAQSAVKADKRCGYESIQSSLIENIFPSSTSACSSLFRQERFLDSLTLEETCKNLQRMFSELFTSDCCIHIISSLENLQTLDVPSLHTKFKLDSQPDTPNFVKLPSFLNKKIPSLMEEDIVIKVAGEETSYMASITPISHSLYDSMDIKMRVFENWFGQLDGVIGREVRGKGLAYHYFSSSSSFDGVYQIQLQQSTDISATVSAVSDLLTDIVTSSNPADLVDSKQVELAKRAVFCSVVRQVRSDHSAAMWDITFIHNNTQRPAFTNIIEELDKVNVEDIVDLCKVYYKKLFDQGQSVKIYSIPQNKNV